MFSGTAGRGLGRKVTDCHIRQSAIFTTNIEGSFRKKQPPYGKVINIVFNNAVL